MPLKNQVRGQLRRLQLGLSIAELAAIAGISSSALSAYETAADGEVDLIVCLRVGGALAEAGEDRMEPVGV